MFNFFLKSCKININKNLKEFENIYISRRKTKTNSRKLINIEEVSEYIVKNGYMEVFMEDLSMKEKIDIIYNSKNIIMENGAGCINLCFCNKDVNIKILHQETILEEFYNTFLKPFLHDKNIIFISGKKTSNVFFKNKSNTPWKVDLNKLKKFF